MNPWECFGSHGFCFGSLKNFEETSKKSKKVIDEFLKDGIITDVLKYTHSCICTNTAGGEVR